MKKFVCLFLMMGMVFVLAACGGGSNPIRDRGTVLDYRSILDTELNLMFSLGDYRGDVEALLGVSYAEHELSSGGQVVVYDNNFAVTYLNNYAISFMASNIFYDTHSSEYTGVRFEILDVPIGITEEQMPTVFEPSIMGYTRIFYMEGSLKDYVIGSHVRHDVSWFSGDDIGYNLSVYMFVHR